MSDDAHHRRYETMRDESRDAIRTVIAPSMYEKMLLVSDGSEVLCSCCTKKGVKVLIRELRDGFESSYRVVDMINIEDGLYCDNCGEHRSEYESE